MATHALPASHIIDSHIVDDNDDVFATTPAARKPVLHRFYNALIESQMRRAQRDIDRVLGPGALARALATELPPER